MKTIALLAAFFLYGNIAWSQDGAFEMLKAIIAQKAPDVKLDSRLIAFNKWSPSDAESRNRNREFHRACDVFGRAKLSGGRKGLVCVAVISENTGNPVIGLKADGATLLIGVTSAELGLWELPATNGVYDQNGLLIYKDLVTEKIFSSVHQLITR